MAKRDHGKTKSGAPITEELIESLVEKATRKPPRR